MLRLHNLIQMPFPQVRQIGLSALPGRVSNQAEMNPKITVLTLLVTMTRELPQHVCTHVHVSVRVLRCPMVSSPLSWTKQPTRSIYKRKVIFGFGSPKFNFTVSLTGGVGSVMVLCHGDSS